MGVKRAGRGTASDQRVHPGAAALVLARVPVRVEAAEKYAALVVHVVVPHLRVPDRNAGLPGDTNSVQTVHQIEQAGHYVLEREIGPQRFFVEGVERRTLLLGVIRDVPGSDFRSLAALNRA